MNNAKKVPRARRQPRNVNNLNKVMRIVPKFMSTMQKHLSMKDVSRLAQVNRFTRDHARRFSPLEESMRHPRIRRSLMQAMVGNPMNAQPFNIIDLERLRAASRSTRQLTQDDYEHDQLGTIANYMRDNYNMGNRWYGVYGNYHRPRSEESGSDHDSDIDIQLSDSD